MGNTAKTNPFDLHQIAQFIPANIYWVDTDSRVIGCNEQQAKVLGFSSAEELYGKTIYDVGNALGWDPSVAEQVRENDLEIMSSGLGQVMEETASIDGEQRTFLSHKNPLHDAEGNIVGIIGAAVDITERKLLEQSLEHARSKAEQASQAKSEFIMNMRHDLKTPASGILGFAQILQNHETDVAKKEQLAYIANSSEKLLELLDEIIDISNIGHNKITNPSNPFSVKQLAKDIVSLLKPEAIQKGIELNYSTDINLPQYLLGDKIRLHRILLNLVSNGIKFTSQGFVHINIECDSKDASKVILKITITDTGIGIAKQHHQQIFDKFQRLTPAYQGVYKGMGLGLYVTKTFIEDLGGTISVESEPGSGTTFSCHIPFALTTQQSQSRRFHSDENEFDFSFTKPTKVLIVEDNIVAQKIAEDLLQGFGCQVDVAASGEETLAKIKNSYDLIFMDIGLPDSDGFSICHSIRKYSSVNNLTPIIGLSAHIDKQTQQQAQEYGMNALLSKPLTDGICRQLFG